MAESLEILYKRNEGKINRINSELRKLENVQKVSDSFKKIKDIIYHYIFDRYERDNKGNVYIEEFQELTELRREKDFLIKTPYANWAREFSDEELKKQYEIFLMDKRFCEKNFLNDENLGGYLMAFSIDRIYRANALENEIKRRKKLKGNA